tara:strand:+ start:1161 stop:1430 length:270 start_codon:yes stop_codon:yes gene_type:complete
MFHYFKIKGESMFPSLECGDLVMTSNLVEIRRNDIVVFKDTSCGTVVKRVSFLDEDYFKVKSDNLKTESPVCAKLHSKKNIIGKVISIF